VQHNDEAKPLTDLFEPGATLMVGAAAGGVLDFRPLTVARVDGGRIDILLDRNEPWVAALGPGATVYATLSDNRANTWVSLRGGASITADRALIDQLWSPFAAAYFTDGPDTPGIAVLSIDAQDGRYWSAPSGRIGSLISMVKAKLGDPETDSGSHGDVKL
jgi:general stress protein 26